MNWMLLQNSLLVAGATTVVAVAAGFVLALAALGTSGRARVAMIAGSVVVLALPPFLVANTWLHLLGLNGAWRPWLSLNIMSLGGSVWVLSLLLWPVAFLLVLAGWRKVHPAHLESDLAVRGRHLLRAVLFPHARPALRASLVITFVLALNQFTVPSLLQTKVLPAEMWVRYNTELDAWAALRLALPLIVAPFLLLLALRNVEAPWKQTRLELCPGLVRRQLGASWFLSSLALSFGLLLFSLVVPLAQIILSGRTWTELPLAIGAAGEPLARSFFYASVVATTVLLTGFLAHPRFIRAVAWILFFIPGMLLALGLIRALNTNAAWSAFLFQTPMLVLLGLALRYLALPASVLSSGMHRVDPALLDDSRILGLSWVRRFRHVYWPALNRPAFFAWYAVYLLCLWDVETTLLLTPPGGETAALRVFNLLHAGYSAQVNALCLALLVLGLSPLILGFASARWLPAMLACAFLTGCSPQVAETKAPIESRLFSEVEVISRRGTGAGEVNKPRSLTVDQSNYLYVVDMTGRVQKFSPAGVFAKSWQMEKTDLGRPKGLCMDRDGNVLVNEPHYSRVNHFSPEGELTNRWGVHGTNDGQLAFPRAVAVNSRREIFVSEYGLVERVQRFAPLGVKWLGGFGSEGSGPGQLNRPEGLCIDQQDRVYVADSCNHRIQVFSATGELLRVFGEPGSGPGQLSYPYDIAVDKEGLQFVCEFGNSRIQVFDPEGRSIEIIGGPGAAPGRFNNPWGVALDAAGNLYVADSLNHRVQKLFRRGK